MKLGDFELHTISDGTFALDGGQLFGVIPKPLWQRKMPADERNRVRLFLNCLLIRTGSENILVDTGIGDKFDAKFKEIYDVRHPPMLIAGLEKLDLRPDDIDIVINTHLHFDHCGWNTRRWEGKTIPTFPRARYFVQRGEWEHALDPTERDRASYVEECFKPAEGQTELLSGGAEIVPGIRVEVVPGHTGDLQCVRVESRGDCAYFISDVVPTAAHLPYPWSTSFDLFPLQTLAGKRRLLPELAREEAVVIFPHDPHVPWARLVDIDGKIATESLK
jgi:glyoxylase-like metal-dependent hydrolase (beta-lactamase superfamily II)